VSDLTDFLMARIAEDEALAREVKTADFPSPWTCDVYAPSVTDDAFLRDADGGAIFESEWSATSDRRVVAHIARHDPTRVLAECEAKRRIVALFEEERERRDIYNRDYDSGEYDFNENDLRARLASNAHCRGLEEAMLALALPYANHPDYDEAWRP